MLTNQDGIRERIIQIRKERGVSQNQLAKDFGISRTDKAVKHGGMRINTVFAHFFLGKI